MNYLNSLHDVPHAGARSLPAGQVWQAALGELQLQMTRATFDTWVKPTFAIAYENGDLVVGVRNAYAKQWLENRLYGMIQRTVSHLIGHSAQIKFILKSEAGTGPFGEHVMNTQDVIGAGPVESQPER